MLLGSSILIRGPLLNPSLINSLNGLQCVIYQLDLKVRVQMD